MVEPSDRDDLFSVIDTNVMVEHLHLINSMQGMHGNCIMHSVTLYVVIQEFDGLKNNQKPHLAKADRDGLRWHHEKLNPSNDSIESCIWGQSFQNRNDIVNPCGDKIGDDLI